MKYKPSDHTFAVCAYGESPYLEECIRSLEKQRRKGKVIICTSTPNAYIEAIAERHHLHMYINKGPAGIAHDWNYAFLAADTPLLTLAHQDDIYEPDYLLTMLRKINKSHDPQISFSDYYEIRNGKRARNGSNLNLLVKKAALMPLRLPFLQNVRFVKRIVLAFCDPICCPSVLYVKKNLPVPLFETQFLADLDWQAWEKISRQSGSFVYVPSVLMGHRIHSESTTTKVIGSKDSRSGEDIEMYKKFWPSGIAHLLNRLYAYSQRSNKLK